MNHSEVDHILRYDVFLSHCSSDKLFAEELAQKLRAEGIEPFLAMWHLIPGEPWQDALHEALEYSETCAILIGSEGLGPWQNREMRAALEKLVSSKNFRVIPVLLPSTRKPFKPQNLPHFLRSLTWVDFKGTLQDPRAYHLFLCGILGVPPGPNQELRNSSNEFKKILRNQNSVTSKPWKIERHRTYLFSALALISLTFVLLGITRPMMRVSQTKKFPATAGLSLPGTILRDCDDCPELMVLAHGRFVMGSPLNEKGAADDERPQTGITIKSFAIGRTEVTFEQWMRCVLSLKCDHLPYDQGWGQGQQPVIGVSWNDSQQFIQWLSEKTGKRYRLPSESEWEYAARAASETSRFWGDIPDHACTFSNVLDYRAEMEDTISINSNVHLCDDGYPYTAPVASYLPNEFGLYDMLGNVWEWTEDCAGSNYTRIPRDGSPYQSSDCTSRQLRGGSWSSGTASIRSANRRHYGLSQDYRKGVDIGFRVAREL